MTSVTTAFQGTFLFGFFAAGGRDRSATSPTWSNTVQCSASSSCSPRPAPAPRPGAGDAGDRGGPRSARCRDRGAGVLRGAALLRDRRLDMGRHHADGRAPTDCGSACGPRRSTPRAAARTCGLLAGPFARAGEDLRTATAPVADERVVPFGPQQVNRRLQVLAAELGLEGRLVALRAPRPGVGARCGAARRPPPCSSPAAGAAPRRSPATPRPSPSRTAPAPGFFGNGGAACPGLEGQRLGTPTADARTCAAASVVGDAELRASDG